MEDYRFEASEFECWSRYYVHFRTNAYEKVMNPFTSTAMGVI